MSYSDKELMSVYDKVVDDVIRSVEQLFILEGIDKSVLEVLKRIWMEKICKSGALNIKKESVTIPKAVPPRQIIFIGPSFATQKTVWQIKLPYSSADQPAAHTIMNNPTGTTPEDLPSTSGISRKKSSNIIQIDGDYDSSTDTSSETEEFIIGKPEVNTEPPLNSDDDISEEDADAFETDNVIVCQYEKITRKTNKWKFWLKSGIMNLNGKDYVFKWFNGDAEW